MPVIRYTARRLSRLAGAVLALALVGTGGVTLGQVGSAPPPNIVIFLVDDLGWQDVQLPFHSSTTALNRTYRTPNLIRLAAQGTVFTNAYAAAPVCTPTRVTLLTGHSPARSHVTNWTQHRDRDTSSAYPLLLPPDWNMNGTSPDDQVPHAFTAPMLPAILRDAGYRTIHAGKAHWGAVDTPGADPRHLGFDVNIGGTAAGQPGSYLPSKNFSSGTESGRFRDVPDLDAYHGTETFLTEALTIEANRAVTTAVADGKPFFLHLAHFAVHTPIETDERFAPRYREAGLPAREVAYASLIEGMDKSLGDVVAHLEQLGVLENTLIVFASDNGGLAAHSRDGEPHTKNAPLRSGKGSAYEGGLRVPLVVSWPEHGRTGTRVDAPSVTDDIFTTVVSAAGVKNLAELTTGLVGRDLSPLLTGENTFPADRPLLWHYPHFWGVRGPGIEPFSALRVGRWKLIFFYTERRYELYDLASDVSEAIDLAATRTDIVGRLSLTLRSTLAESGAQLPLNPDTRQPVDLPPVIR